MRNLVRGGEYDKPDYLCFTANTAGSTVQLTKIGNPTVVSLETSTNGISWSDYTIGDTITLSNIGDKVYRRNKSETDTGFSVNNSDYYHFDMTGSVAGSGDINYLLNKNSTNVLSECCYFGLFIRCTSLTTAPSLPATSLAQLCYYFMFRFCANLTTAPELPATSLDNWCYANMFQYCTSLTTVPSLPATSLTSYCYYEMFSGCSNIKLSATQDSDYTQEYRIPVIGTGTEGNSSLSYMFTNTGGTFTGDATINTTYYLHKDNTIV